MSKAEFKLNGAGVRELLQGAEMQSILQTAAEKAAAAAMSDSGLEYNVEPRMGKKRAKAIVTPGNAHAYYSNLKHNWLLKALGSARI